MQLKTARLILREFTTDDWQTVLAYQQDSRYLRYYPWQTRTSADVQRFVQGFLDDRRAEPRRRFSLAITRAGEEPLIGIASLRRAAAVYHQAEIGYEVNPEFWGQGYGSEAARALLRLGFEELGLQRISAVCVADNVPSARVLEKIGMQQEGRLRRDSWFKGRWWDTLLYGILCDEWQQQQG
jgi:[ribosomal protein S5]-alanine N-acetyltransferase